MAVDIKEVVKTSNTRPEDGSAYESPVKKLGSRVTSKQASIVNAVLTDSTRKALRQNVKALQQYADTGDAGALSEGQSEVLKTVVAQCRERAENPSQARRFWPRKVAAIVVNL